VRLNTDRPGGHHCLHPDRRYAPTAPPASYQ
jgi:hypothetical protein